MVSLENSYLHFKTSIKYPSSLCHPIPPAVSDIVFPTLLCVDGYISANQGESGSLEEADLGSNLASDISLIHSLNKDLLGICLLCASHLNGEQ